MSQGMMANPKSPNISSARAQTKGDVKFAT
jgi:hypothetical protein